MKRRTMLLAAISGIVVLTSGIALSAVDFGLMRDQLLTSKTQSLFGVNADIAASSTTSADPTAAAADASRLVTVAKGST